MKISKSKIYANTKRRRISSEPAADLIALSAVSGSVAKKAAAFSKRIDAKLKELAAARFKKFPELKSILYDVVLLPSGTCHYLSAPHAQDHTLIAGAVIASVTLYRGYRSAHKVPSKRFIGIRHRCPTNATTVDMMSRLNRRYKASVKQK